LAVSAARLTMLTTDISGFLFGVQELHTCLLVQGDVQIEEIAFSRTIQAQTPCHP